MNKKEDSIIDSGWKIPEEQKTLQQKMQEQLQAQLQIQAQLQQKMQAQVQEHQALQQQFQEKTREALQKQEKSLTEAPFTAMPQMMDTGNLRVASIMEESIVDGPGMRLVVFFQGCRHNCPGCHNPDTHAMDGGYLVSDMEILNRALRNPMLRGITFSGGEPFLQASVIATLAQEARIAGLDIVTYTGFTFEQIMAHRDLDDGFIALLNATDILVDGLFIQELRTLDQPFIGSKNQRIINVPATLNNNEIIVPFII